MYERCGFQDLPGRGNELTIDLRLYEPECGFDDVQRWNAMVRWPGTAIDTDEER